MTGANRDVKIITNYKVEVNNMSKENYTLKNILVVIDPAKETQYALERALKMNKLLDGGVNIHLFISIEMDELSNSQDKFDFYCNSDWFVNLIQPLIEEKVSYTAYVFWTEDWYSSILNATERQGIDLIIMSDYATEKNQNVLSAGKWSLLRSSVCPVLLVHPSVKLWSGAILAAVNMQTTNPRYIDLNEKILKMSDLIAGSYGAVKHIVNAYKDSADFPDRAKLLRDAETKQENTHVSQGDPITIIVDVADDIDADVVVIGTLSRRGIMAAMRGNKCEKIIQKLNRDIMILN